MWKLSNLIFSSVISSLPIAPPPPPTNLMVTDVGLSTFTMTWTEPVSDCGSTFSYEISSDCGGTCSVTNSMSGVCSGWTATGQTCPVRMRAVSNLCGGQNGTYSIVNLNLTGVLFACVLSFSRRVFSPEPSPPLSSDIGVYPVYQQTNGALISLTVSFPPVVKIV